MAKRRKMRGTYCESKEAPKERFDRRSFRTIKSGSSWLIIGCPRGEWNARAERCEVGTRAHKILTPAKDKACAAGEKRIQKG